MAWVAFHKFKQGQMDSSSQPNAPIDFNGDDLRILLITSAVNPASHVASWDDVAAMLSTASVAEVSGSNYARKEIGNEEVTLAAGTVKIDGDNPSKYSQHASGFNNARYAILYKHNAADASAPVIGYYDLGANKGNVDGDLTLEFSAAGIFTFA
jgi:hypothetical protein